MTTFTLTPAGLARLMQTEGYRQAAPSPTAATIDAVVCAESTCEKCGHVGLEYWPFTKPGSYVAYGVCPQCSYQTEL
jgi:hypothetical protein